MAWRLIRIGLSPRYPEPRMFPEAAELPASADVVIIGAGGHGLATAYNLARHHGVRRIVVLEKGYIGSGNTGRNTTIIRSNYLTPEGVRFYERSMQIWRGLSDE
ncbi:MAG: FAD-binding oxidoreductase, partial [Pseudomonadota bacterium]